MARKLFAVMFITLFVIHFVMFDSNSNILIVELSGKEAYDKVMSIYNDEKYEKYSNKYISFLYPKDCIVNDNIDTSTLFELSKSNKSSNLHITLCKLKETQHDMHFTPLENYFSGNTDFTHYHYSISGLGKVYDKYTHIVYIEDKTEDGLVYNVQYYFEIPDGNTYAYAISTNNREELEFILGSFKYNF